MGAVRHQECDRARFRLSLALDGDLSELEHASLRAHVGRCAACAAFGHELGALTFELRTAPQVPLATADTGARPAISPALPRRRSKAPRVLQLSAATVVLAAGLGSLAGSLASRTPVTRTATKAIGVAGRGDLGVQLPRGVVATAPPQRRTTPRTSRSVAL